MVKQTADILSGYIIEDESRLTLRQLCDLCAVNAEYIIELVNEGFIEPSGMEKSHWCFNGVSIRRVQQAKRLQHDLGINFAGVALAIDLINEIEHLRAQLDRV